MSDDSSKNVEVRKRKRKFYKECCAEGCDFSEPFKMVPQKNVNQKEEVKIIKNPIFEEVSRRICKDKKRSNFSCTSCNTGITFYWGMVGIVTLFCVISVGLGLRKGVFTARNVVMFLKRKKRMVRNVVLSVFMSGKNLVLVLLINSCILINKYKNLINFYVIKKYFEQI